MRRKKASLYSYSEDEVPPSTDTRWPRWADLISTRMTEPKSAAQLIDDCPEFSFAMLCNVLSWMDIRGMVTKRREGKTVYWALAPKPVEMRIPDKCPWCGGRWADTSYGQACFQCGRLAEKAARPASEFEEP